MSLPPRWGQLVCGPPGSGKSSYCAAVCALLSRAGRPCAVVNLDPAAEAPPYAAAVSVAELISVADAADAYGLGPNGGLMYCAEFLAANGDWLAGRLRALPPATYLLLDCPGQAELFTHHGAFAALAAYLGKPDVLGLRLAAVHLVDAHHCADAAKFIAAALLSLTAMLRLELPHVNVLSKLDLVRAYGQPPFSLDFYTELQDMTRLAGTIADHAPAQRAPWRVDRGPAAGAGSAGAEAGAEDGEEGEGGGGGGGGPGAAAGAAAGELDGAAIAAAVAAAAAPPVPDAVARAADARRRAFASRHRRLHAALADVIQDYALLSYVPISVREPESLVRLIKLVDKAHGYVPGGGGGGGATDAAASDLLAGAPTDGEYERLGRFEERYFPRTEGGDDGDADAAADEEEDDDDDGAGGAGGEEGEG